MHWFTAKQRNRGATIIEVFVVIILVLFVAFTLIFPTLGGSRKAQWPHCANSQRQLGSAFQMWANDNHGKFPMLVSTNDGGTREWGGASNLYHHFVVLSNLIPNSRILACPTDGAKMTAPNFSELGSHNISYFLCLNARRSNPRGILAGDRNLMLQGIPFTNGCYYVPAQQDVVWTSDLHNMRGNVLLIDGSVVQKRGDLQKALQNTGDATNRLAFP